MPKPPHKVRGKTVFLKLTPQQAISAREFGVIKKSTSGYQTVFAEIADGIMTTDGNHVASVFGDRMDKLKEWAGRRVTGGYQEWCRDVLTANSISWT